MFEFSVGKGKLFVCSADLSDKTDYVARQLLKSIIEYMDSDEFMPEYKIEVDKISSVFTGSTKYIKSRKTNEEGNIKGYDFL